LLSKIKPAFPIFLLALLVQIFAPVAARVEMAEASQLWSVLTICSHANSLADRQDPTHHRHSDDCCDFCQIATGATPPLAPAVFAFAAPINSLRLIAWVVPTECSLSPIHDNQAQARAPPTSA